MEYITIKVLFATAFVFSYALMSTKAAKSDIRLLGSPPETPNAGRVQIYDSGQWKDVCYDGGENSKQWSIIEAMVACSQLGYPGTAFNRKGGYGNGNSAYALDGFNCFGDVNNLSECETPKHKKRCANNAEAGVICTVPGYLGCFADAEDRVLPDAMLEHNSMTIQTCRDFCNSQTPKMRYAGVQDMDECYCGAQDNFRRLGRKSDSECNTPCGGNSDEICGGKWRISRYDLLLGKCADSSPNHGSTGEQDFSFGKWVTFACGEGYELIGDTSLQCVLGDTPDNCTWSGEPPKCQVPGYLGCFVDAEDRVLPDAKLVNNSMTIQMCRDFCNSQTPKMRYAGVQTTFECFCGAQDKSFRRLGRTMDNECNMPCRGKPDEICGGHWRISVYDLQGCNCADPSPEHGSTLEQDFSFGKWITFACDKGYDLVGESTLQCALGETPDNCIWNGEPPKCQESRANTTPRTREALSTLSLNVSLESQQGGLAIGMIGVVAGSFVDGLLLLLLLIVLFLFLVKPRFNKQGSTASNELHDQSTTGNEVNQTSGNNNNNQYANESRPDPQSSTEVAVHLSLQQKHTQCAYP